MRLLAFANTFRQTISSLGKFLEKVLLEKRLLEKELLQMKQKSLMRTRKAAW